MIDIEDLKLKISECFLKVVQKVVDVFGYSIVEKKELLDFYLHDYDSYEQYRDIQIFHNKRKIKNVWADEVTLDRVLNIILKEDKGSPYVGVCHGTRNGFEQGYLNKSNKVHAIGTDISETALNYEHSVQWDFHNPNTEWEGKFDFVYSNSLDQSWKPQLALQTWLNQVKVGGIVIIEHTDVHGPRGASEMDPFGVRPVAMPYVLTEWFGDQISITHSKQKKGNMNEIAWLFVCKKLVNNVSLSTD